MCTVLSLYSLRSWQKLKLLNMAGSKQSNCLDPQSRQLPLATDCWLLEVQQKTPAQPPALVMPYSCCYSRREAQAGWVVGTCPRKEDRMVGSFLQLHQSLSPFLTSCRTANLTPHGFVSHISVPASLLFFTSPLQVPPGSLPLRLVFSGPPQKWFSSHEQQKKKLIKKCKYFFCLANKSVQWRFQKSTIASWHSCEQADEKAEAEKKGRRNRSIPFSYSKLLGCLSSTVELYPRAQGKVKRVLSATIIMD